MSLDLYERESGELLSRMAPVRDPDVGVWDGFLRGAGLTTMRGLARTGSAVDMLGSIGPILKDAVTGGTELQDRYFKEHDEVWGSAVDYWTPKPNEVGVAGQMVGELASMLPLIIASPSLAVASTQLATGEELVKKDVESGKAQAVGAVQAGGLGLGIWMPIIGQNLWQRVVVGGAGFNLLQGIGTRGASGAILQGTPAAEEFKAFDGSAMTLDVLLGAAFGSLVHLSSQARTQGAETWNRIVAWAEDLSPTEKAAIMALRQAQHLNVDSVPGIPAAPADVEAHVQRVRTAIEQMERGQPVEVSDLPEPRVEPDPARAADAAQRADEMVKQAEQVRKTEGLPPANFDEIAFALRNLRENDIAPIGVPEVSKTALTPMEHGGATGIKTVSVNGEVVSKADIIIDHDGVVTVKKIETLASARRRGYATALLDNIFKEFSDAHIRRNMTTDAGAAFLKQYRQGNGLQILPRESEAPAAMRGGTEPPPPRGPRGAEAAGAEGIKEMDPVATAAERVAKERPDMKIHVGTDAEGKPIVKSARQYLDDARAHVEDARRDVTLFEAAARCLLGGG